MAAVNSVPQLVDKKGGSYAAIAPKLEPRKFNKWKKLMLCYLARMEPYYLKCIKDGPFQPKITEGDDKLESQWTPDERTMVVQDQLLKIIIMSCLPYDIRESVISCKTAKATWTDLVHNFEGRGTIIQIFYHGLDKATQAILNVEGIFLYKTPNEAHQLLEDRVLLKLDWSKDIKAKPFRKTVAFTEGSDNSQIMEKMEALTTKIDSQFKDIKGEIKEMRDGCNSYGGPYPSSECDDKPIGGPKDEEANFAYGGY
ncbi:hypothetical protein Tco_0568007 [Tanacetum coccineum]